MEKKGEMREPIPNIIYNASSNILPNGGKRWKKGTHLEFYTYCQMEKKGKMRERWVIFFVLFMNIFFGDFNIH